LIETQLRIRARAAPPAAHPNAATVLPSLLQSTKRMCMKIASIATPSTTVMVQASGIAKLPRDGTTRLAARPSIHTPLASVSNEAASTAWKKAAEHIVHQAQPYRRFKLGDGRAQEEVRKSHAAIHTMMDITCRVLRVAQIVEHARSY
jgi:hypothetical protein